MTAPVSESAGSTQQSLGQSRELIIPLWMRRDLGSQPVFAQGEPGWSIKDPVSLNYFRLGEPEFAVLQLLDGSRTCSQLVDELRQRFPWEEWDQETVFGFLQHLESSGLAISRHAGTGARVARLAGVRRRHQRLAFLVGILAVRFRGIDPHRLLGWLYPIVKGLFSVCAQRLLLSMIATAAVLVVLRFDEVIYRLPELQSFVAPHNFLSLVLAIVVIKLLHEVGHAITCHHYGGKCHELGVLLLVFMPVLYCDVSDAWMLPTRRARMAISAAGIIVELVLASLFVFLWWWSIPGWLNSFCVNVMVVCSVNTVFFNGNPLLKYDGYYVLSDLVRIPNLRSQSRHAVQSLFGRIILGESADNDAPPTSREWFLLVYGFMSIVYQFVVIAAILWFVTEVFESWHIGILGHVLVIPVLAGMIVMPALKLFLRVRMHLRSRHTDRRRAAAGLFLLGGGIVAALATPIPNTVIAPFVISPAGAQPVYVTVPGRIESKVVDGTQVSKGEHLGRLTNPSLHLERERLAARAEQLELRLNILNDQRGLDSGVSLQIPATRDALQGARAQLAELNREVVRLNISSPATGVVLAPPNIPASLSADKDRESPAASRWSGTPLEPRNSGAYLQQQTLFCLVGQPGNVEATLIVDQSMVEFVAVGQSVRLTMQSAPGRSLHGTVDEIARADILEMPREILAAGLAPLPQKVGAHSTNAGDVAYQIRVRIDVPDVPVSLYSPGQARIDCGWLPTAELLWRQFRQTFSTL
jgi:putative peptide zinc metalloprotease protein